MAHLSEREGPSELIAVLRMPPDAGGSFGTVTGGSLGAVTGGSVGTVTCGSFAA